MKLQRTQQQRVQFLSGFCHKSELEGTAGCDSAGIVSLMQFFSFIHFTFLNVITPHKTFNLAE